MASKYGRLVSQPVPQTEPLNPRQVKNNAGGFVFQISDWSRLERFLILGSDAQTYYQSARKLTKENAECVQRCLDLNPTQAIGCIVDISVQGRAPKNDPAIFALALASIHKKEDVRREALIQISSVCRIPTHLFQFIQVRKALGGGWGRAMKRAVANWYDQKPVDKLAYQVIKYRSRENLTHKNVLQMSHPKGDGTGKTDYKYRPKLVYVDGRKGFGKQVNVCKGVGRESDRAALYRWICGKDYDDKKLPSLVDAHLVAMADLGTKKAKLDLIRAHRLPWEAIPTECLKDPKVWEAMLPNLGATALIRNLSTMTELGLLAPLTDESNYVSEKLTDVEFLQKGRVHPFNVLLALAVYRSGKSVKGSRSWNPSKRIIDALDEAFYLAFKTIIPTGKRTLIGIDVSGSMSSPLMGSPLLVCEGAAAMAMVTAKVENNYHIMAFNNGMQELPITAKSSLGDVLKHTKDINAGGTDCSLPMLYAKHHNLKVDVFEVITDNETWAGRVHPSIALQDYRNSSGIKDAKLVVTGMTSTQFTIADPNDANMMDVVGFDSAAPSVIANFVRGDGGGGGKADEDDAE